MNSTLRPTFIPATLFSLLLAGAAAEAAPNAVHNLNLQPTITGVGNDTNFDGHWDSMGPGCCLAYNGLPDTYNYRSAIEFDLGVIPSGASIQSATFYIQYDGANGFPGDRLQFNQYVGNGSLDLTDFEQINQIALLNSFGPDDGTLWYKVPAGSIVQSFVGQGQQYLGFMIQNITWGQTALLNPYLSVSYVVPEPMMLYLAGSLGSAVCLFHRQRRSLLDRIAR